MKILFLITARGGSERLPGKNLREIGGIPLIGYKAISAKKSKYCTRLIASTDSQRIAEVARSYGAAVPFLRSPELATRDAASIDVVLDAMDWVEKYTEDRYESVMVLEPSTPFARAIDYDKGVEIMLEKDANVVLGMREMEVDSTFVGRVEADGRIPEIIAKMSAWPGKRSGELRREVTMNGAFYLAKWDHIKECRSLYADAARTYGYVMERHYSVEIDELVDLHWAQFLVEHRYVDVSYWQDVQENGD